MYYRKSVYLLTAFLLVFIIVLGSSAIAADPAARLRDRFKAASPALKDITATMVVTSINKKNAGEINPAFSEIGQFQKARIYYKRPNKFRADGVAKGMAVAYVLNGTRRQVVIPGILKRNEDVSGKPGKQTNTLDMGFLTDEMWNTRTVTYLGTENGAVKLKLDPKKDNTRRHELVWVDPNTLKLVKRQRYNSDGELRAKYVYGDYIMVGKLPVARQAKIYAPDGGFVGTVEYQDMKVNTGLLDSLFNLVK